MARRPSSRSWEEVPGPRGGVVRFLVGPGGTRKRTRAEPAPGDRVLRVRPGADPEAVKVTRSGRERRIPTTTAMRRAATDTWAALGATSPVGSAPHEWALRHLADATGAPEPVIGPGGFVAGGRIDRRPGMSERLGVSRKAWTRGGPQLAALENVAATARRFVGRAHIHVRDVFATQGERSLLMACYGEDDGMYQSVLDRSRTFYVTMVVTAGTEAGARMAPQEYAVMDSYERLPGALLNGLIFPVVTATPNGGWEVSSGKRQKKPKKSQRVSWIRANLMVWETAA